MDDRLNNCVGVVGQGAVQVRDLLSHLLRHADLNIVGLFAPMS
jgi:hypothetical protein